MKKVVIAGAILAVVAVIVGANLKASGAKGEKVDVAAVDKVTLRGIVEASGRLQPAVSVSLSSDVIGRVVAVGAEEGSVVEVGQILIQIDPTPFELAAASAQANLQASESRLNEVRANLFRTRRDFERDRALHREQLLPDSALEASTAAFDALTAALRTAEHNVSQARAAVDEAAERLRKTEIRSPMAGVVVRRNVEVGEVAVSGTLNNQGSLLMTVADLSVMRAEVEVDETDVIHVGVGQAADVEIDAYPGRSFAGQVSEVAHSAALPGTGDQRQSADYAVVVTLQASDVDLRPGLSATARIETAVREGVLAVPIQAVVVRDPKKTSAKARQAGKRQKPEKRPPQAQSEAKGVDGKHAEDDGAQEQARADQGGEAGTEPADGGEAAAVRRRGPDEPAEEVEGVFVVVDGVTEFRPVQLGITGERQFEVTAGLNEGDQVVTGPFRILRKLESGDKVTVDTRDPADRDAPQRD